jgi:hypothetical protein
MLRRKKGAHVFIMALASSGKKGNSCRKVERGVVALLNHLKTGALPREL